MYQEDFFKMLQKIFRFKKNKREEEKTDKHFKKLYAITGANLSSSENILRSIEMEIKDYEALLSVTF